MSVSNLLPAWAAPRHRRRAPRLPQCMTLSLIVDYADAVRVRRALMQGTAPGIEILECHALPHSHSARMRIGCDAAHAADIMHRVIEAVDAAQFGPLSGA